MEPWPDYDETLSLIAEWVQFKVDLAELDGSTFEYNWPEDGIIIP